MEDRFDVYGPYTISNDKVYVKTYYYPLEFGSTDLRDIITKKKNELTRELSSWCQLEHDNERAMNATD